MKNYLSLIAFIFCLVLGLSGCGTTGGQEPNMEELGFMAQFLHQTDGGAWVLIPTSSKGFPAENTNVEEPTLVGDGQESVPPAVTGHYLVGGKILHSSYSQGTFLVEARRSKNCDQGMCPDMDSIPTASILLNAPGYFSLVTPQDGEPVYVVVTYQVGDAKSSKDRYLGILDRRVEGIDFDFTPGDPPSGPDDLAAAEPDAGGLDPWD